MLPALSCLLDIVCIVLLTCLLTYWKFDLRPSVAMHWLLICPASRLGRRPKRRKEVTQDGGTEHMMTSPTSGTAAMMVPGLLASTTARLQLQATMCCISSSSSSSCCCCCCCYCCSSTSPCWCSRHYTTSCLRTWRKTANLCLSLVASRRCQYSMGLAIKRSWVRVSAGHAA